MGEEHGLQPLDAGLPPLAERIRGVLLEPGATFARHDPSWGWIGPWLVVALAGVLYGLVVLARIDVVAVQRAEAERAMEQLDPATRRRIESDPKTQEILETTQRFMAFAGKVGLIVGPPVTGLGGLLVGGMLCFGASALLARRRPGAPRPDLTRCLSLAAHVSLVELVGVAARTIGALGGNHAPSTSAVNLVDAITQPVAAAALSRLDPVTLLYWAVLAAGLHGSLGLPRRASLGLAAGGYAAVSLGAVAIAGLGALASKLGAA
ncbi:MAG: hypothetical protein M9894_31270 [Planctomycetes bacterium]|nr:hypothetical protein [Planctomycetota bacterium]